MPRFRLLIEYAGTRYSGWQVQKNARTVAGEIERAARAAAAVTDLELYGAGRTDAGVHALGQTAHLDLRTSLPAETLRRRINDGLPADINILSAEPVPHRFHARHDALSRTYLYQISLRRTAFAKPFVWWIREPLVIDEMRRAAAMFEGFNDFSSFTRDDPAEKSTAVAVARVAVEATGALVLIRVEGSHFLWKMVRRMVGVMVAAGRGTLGVDDVSRFLREPSSVPAEVTAPPSGLFLERVTYPGDAPVPDAPPLLALR